MTPLGVSDPLSFFLFLPVWTFYRARARARARARKGVTDSQGGHCILGSSDPQSLDPIGFSDPGVTESGGSLYPPTPVPCQFDLP